MGGGRKEGPKEGGGLETSMAQAEGRGRKLAFKCVCTQKTRARSLEKCALIFGVKNSWGRISLFLCANIFVI